MPRLSSKGKEMTPYQQELIRLANDEWLAYYQYWAGAAQVKNEKLKSELLEHADEERKHSDWLTDILADYGLTPEKQFSNIIANTNCGYDMPVQISDGNILQSNLTAERCAIEAYSKILMQTDNPKHHKVLHKILAEEMKHEQDLLKLQKETQGMYLVRAIIRKSQMSFDFGNHDHHVAYDMHKSIAHPVSLIKSRKLHGRMDYQGIPISIETGRSRIREWHNPHNDTQGMMLMKDHYGYITNGPDGTDGDKLDVYVGPDMQAANVYIVNQMKAPDFQSFDEQKIMLGYPDEGAARKAYLRHYDNPQFLGCMDTMPFAEFKQKIESGEYHGKMIKSESEQKLAAFKQAVTQEGGPEWDAYSPKEILQGMDDEQEHADVTNGDLLKTAKIVLAHLKEHRNYYTKLKAAGLE